MTKSLQIEAAERVADNALRRTFFLHAVAQRGGRLLSPLSSLALGRVSGPVLGLAILLPLAACGSRQPGPPVFNDPYPPVGVKLSPRERGASRPTRLSNGKVTLRPDNDGLPFLFGLGDATGKPSAKPTVNGVTPSVSASTPSNGVVPGQDPV